MKLKMVIADDESLALKSEEIFIRREFPQIEIVGLAHDGIELKEMVESLKPDLAVCDIRMPGLSGLEVIQLERSVGSSTHYIIRTAYSDFDYVKSALDLRTDGYLLKPCKREEQIETIRRLIHTIEQEHEARQRDSEVRSVLSRVNPALENELLLSIISGECDVNGFEAYCSLNHITFRSMTVVTFLLYAPQGRGGQDSIREVLSALLDGFCHFISVTTKVSIVVLLFLPEETEPDRQHAWSQEIAQMIADGLKETASVSCRYGVGSAVQNFQDLPQSYRTSRSEVSPEDSALPDPARKAEGYIDSALRYVQENFRRDISLEDCADAVGISPYYLSHLFSEKEHETFVEYLSEVRIEEAKRLSRETDMTAAEIAGSCGYSNITYFYRVFKKAVGFPIGEYRKKAKEEHHVESK